MNHYPSAAILGLLLLAPTAQVAAQQPPDLPQALVRVDPGDTVTILDSEGRRLAGRVWQVSSSSLTLVQGGRATSVPLQRVARITISDTNRNECFGIVVALAGAGAAGGAGIGSSKGVTG